MTKIPFNRPYLGREEQEAVARALEGGVLGGDGPITRRVEDQLRELLGVRHVLMTTSCTHSLEMAMLALGVGPGDEVLMPSFTFVSCANAVVLRGARPVFTEIRAGDLNLDPDDLARRITPRTRAIVVVHYAGVACDMDPILALAAERGIPIVEDAAQAIDAGHEGRPLGTLGAMGCFSFHDTKNITCGEGGAFVTDDDEIARRAELTREKGTNRSAFLRGEIDKYSWVSEGSSYVQSDLLMALLEAQLTKRAEIRVRRERVSRAYREALAPLASSGDLMLPEVPSYARPNYHLFFFRVATRELRDRTLAALAANGIGAAFHYVPLHSSPYGRELSGDVDLPVTQHCSETLIRLPLYPQLDVQAELLAKRVAGVVAEQVGQRAS